MGRLGDGEMGRWGDGETGRWGDWETGRWGDGEIILKVNIRKMNTESVIEKFRKSFSSDILEVNVKNGKRIVISIVPASLPAVADYLYRKEEFRFIIASALHTRHGFEIHYHFSKDIIGLILNIHVVLEKENPQIESLSNMFSASNWIEREMHELYGIVFLNHPCPEKLLSEGNWAEGVYPGRNNFDK